jgi:hypothetical protein
MESMGVSSNRVAGRWVEKDLKTTFFSSVSTQVMVGGLI